MSDLQDNSYNNSLITVTSLATLTPIPNTKLNIQAGEIVIENILCNMCYGQDIFRDFYSVVTFNQIVMSCSSFPNF